MKPRVPVPANEIAALCRRHHIRRLSLFGSVLREDFTATSDVDMVVEFESGMTPGLSFITIEDELSALMGRRVDLNTPSSLSRYFRQDVLDEAQTVYVSA